MRTAIPVLTDYDVMILTTLFPILFLLRPQKYHKGGPTYENQCTQYA